MIEETKQIKKELKTYIRPFAVLFLSLKLINSGFSISYLTNFSDNDKIIWTLDLATYTLLINILFTCFKLLYLKYRLHCEVHILNKKEEFNEITLRDTTPADISVKIDLKGRRWDFKNKLEICFPSWLDTQVKPTPYIQEEQNKYLIDLNHFTSSKYVKCTESITFNVIKNTDENNTALVEAYLKINWLKRLFLGFESKGIRIKLK
ncbi:hypothetical protein NQS41_10065 [Bacillus sp. C3(2022)]|uniref:hypothetical protein n=1 Tax=Bacillus TaxID=1386 RepID=UPI000BA55449|nr:MULTISPECIES: hypothetical protein [Bacillus subtilis group]PAD00158.1 hypothetical protein CHH86_03110 [Bacillus paralicheniformis]